MLEAGPDLSFRYFGSMAPRAGRLNYGGLSCSSLLVKIDPVGCIRSLPIGRGSLLSSLPFCD